MQCCWRVCTAGCLTKQGLTRSDEPQRGGRAAGLHGRCCACPYYLRPIHCTCVGLAVPPRLCQAGRGEVDKLLEAAGSALCLALNPEPLTLPTVLAQG